MSDLDDKREKLRSRKRPTKLFCSRAANIPAVASPSPPSPQPQDGASTSGSIAASG